VLSTAVPIQGGVSLQYASFGIIRDDPATWSAELLLNGLLQCSSPPAPVSLRPRQPKTGAMSDPDGSPPQPYEQLAANYRSLGGDSDARLVLLARQ
jgi:hypothetical protein